jgi:hypothetical protein
MNTDKPTTDKPSQEFAKLTHYRASMYMPEEWVTELPNGHKDVWPTEAEAVEWLRLMGFAS